MEYKTEFSFPLSEELLKTLGIDEDTAFETYYEDGRIRVRVLDEEELEIHEKSQEKLEIVLKHTTVKGENLTNIRFDKISAYTPCVYTIKVY